MPSLRSLIGSRRLLARHLDRLSATLENFGVRLREAVSSAVGDTVAGIVRDTIQMVLAEQLVMPSSSARFVPSARHGRRLWNERDDYEEEPWFDEPDGYPPEDHYEEARPTSRVDRNPTPSRLPRAIAIGFQTTLCWLRRKVGRFPVLTAVSVGLLTALAVFAGGPLAAAAVGLAGSAFHLLSLAEAVHAGADTLANFSIS